MKLKDCVLNFVLSILIIVFGTLLLLDQLSIKFIDDFFTPWYTIPILYVAASLLAIAIVKKAPVVYVLSMIAAASYLLVSLPAKIQDLPVYKIIFILPMFIGIGIIIGDLTCKWSKKALRFGITMTVASVILLVAFLYDVWRIVMPIVIVLYGATWLIFVLIDVKMATRAESVDESVYVTPSKDKQGDDKSE